MCFRINIVGINRAAYIHIRQLICRYLPTLIQVRFAFHQLTQIWMCFCISIVVANCATYINVWQLVYGNFAAAVQFCNTVWLANVQDNLFLYRVIHITNRCKYIWIDMDFQFTLIGYRQRTVKCISEIRRIRETWNRNTFTVLKQCKHYRRIIVNMSP